MMPCNEAKIKIYRHCCWCCCRRHQAGSLGNCKTLPVTLLSLCIFLFSLLLFVVLVCCCCCRCCCLLGVRERVSKIRIVDKLISLYSSESREKQIRNKERRSNDIELERDGEKRKSPVFVCYA